MILGKEGRGNVIATFGLLKMLDEIKPDIIHLHNLHTNYINVKMLFNYIAKRNIKVIWTLHDCIPFTGHCAHFLIVKCEKWKSGCFNCPSYRDYPKALIDTSKSEWYWKKKIYTSIKNMILVTPSAWLSSLVKESYLKEYPLKVINNGIDLEKFHPRESWIQKGLDRIERIAEKLDDRFQIVLVGIERKSEIQ